MNMEDNENKDDAGKRIPWLIESLKKKRRKKKTEIPWWRPGAETSQAIQAQQHAKRHRTAQLSKQKNARAREKIRQRTTAKKKKKQGQKEIHQGQKQRQRQKHRETTQRPRQNEWEMKKEKQKQKKKHDFHMCTSTEGTTRAFPDQKSCTLMARQKDHEARNL